MFCNKCGTELGANTKSCLICNVSLEKTTNSSMSEKTDYEIGLLGIPLFGIIALVFWVSNLSLIEGIADKLLLTGIFVVISTALLVAIEVSKNSNKGDQEIGTPIYWMFCVALLWIVLFPEYLRKRAVFGLKNRLALGVVLTLFFTYYFVSLSIAVNERKEEIRGDFESLRKQSEQSVKEFNLQMENIQNPDNVVKDFERSMQELNKTITVDIPSEYGASPSEASPSEASPSEASPNSN
jgi:hypothetical protein